MFLQLLYTSDSPAISECNSLSVNNSAPASDSSHWHSFSNHFALGLPLVLTVEIAPFSLFSVNREKQTSVIKGNYLFTGVVSVTLNFHPKEGM